MVNRVSADIGPSTTDTLRLIKAFSQLTDHLDRKAVIQLAEDFAKLDRRKFPRQVTQPIETHASPVWRDGRGSRA